MWRLDSKFSIRILEGIDTKVIPVALFLETSTGELKFYELGAAQELGFSQIAEELNKE